MGSRRRLRHQRDEKIRMNIKNILTASLEKRCIFHSEADFQHHLAWLIHESSKAAKIRLEYPLSRDDSTRWEYCDILLNAPRRIGIELKYKTKLASINVGEERFELKNQAAQDIGRYDFLKDVLRLEKWCAEGTISSGYAIILTNDHTYWTPPKNENTVDKDFRIHNRVISGKLAWGEKASAGTMKKRESPIVLKNEYSLEWKDSPDSDFKYLFLSIAP